jgi:putative transposase
VGLYYHLQERNIKAPDVAGFVHHLLQHLRGHVVLLWDKARIHKGKPVTALCRRYKRLHLEWFPGYAPELNPVEFVWNQEKRELANHCPAGIKELKRKVRSNSRRIKHSQRLLRSCIWASALPWQR